jgi:hypothetical protein
MGLKSANRNAFPTDGSPSGLAMNLLWTFLNTVHVPACPAGIWTLVQEYVPGNRLLRATVLHEVLQEDQKKHLVPVIWNTDPNSPCGPDGLYLPNPTKSASALLCVNAAYGALIGKIGGSTDDLPDPTAGVVAPWGTKRVFAVGWDCILALSTAADGGPLFLTMNDHPERFAKHSGELVVQLQYYPL